jgi:putative DNA methylase
LTQANVPGFSTPEESVDKAPPFWKLAQSRSALYVGGSEEKRWVDEVLARKKGLGF